MKAITSTNLPLQPYIPTDSNRVGHSPSQLSSKVTASEASDYTSSTEYGHSDRPEKRHLIVGELRYRRVVMIHKSILVLLL